jgi:hypothetical protein
MASQIEICNIALVKLGANSIVSLNDGTKSANVLSAIYDALLETELTSHPWTFAATRALIPASSTAPSFGWGAQYPLPADYLKMVEVGTDWVFYASNSPIFAIEGRAVLTDQGSPLPIRYIKKLASTGIFPATFVTSFACRLAAESCEALTQSLSKKQALWQERTEAIREAKRTNDIELPPQTAAPQSWERSLYGWEG